jgi:hypothetical protein
MWSRAGKLIAPEVEWSTGQFSVALQHLVQALRVLPQLLVVQSQQPQSALRCHWWEAEERVFLEVEEILL